MNQASGSSTPVAPTGGLTVALDGPSSSGKSTVGMEAARRLRYRFCDTGLLYRAVTWLALDRGVPAAASPALVALVDEVHLVADARQRLRRVEVEGRDVTREVRTARVDRSVSDYSQVAELRAALVPRQRAIAAGGRIIVAGRDIGTVILPDADLKIYLDASIEERARRRAHQRRGETGPDGTAAEGVVLDWLRRRDTIDTGRAVAPLRVADDAIVLNTDGNEFDQTVAEVVAAIAAAEAVALDGAAGPPALAAAATEAAGRAHGQRIGEQVAGGPLEPAPAPGGADGS